MGLFGKSQQANPKEMVNEWNHKLRKEGNNLERQVRNIQREIEKTKRLLKESAKKNEKESCRILAKEIVKANKQINKIYASKAQLNSVQMSMKQQLANLRIAGALAKSTEVMKSMQQLVKIPEIQATMREMSKEMMKAGIMEEMMEDAMDVFDDDELEEEADEEVDKVLYELTAGELGKAPEAVDESLPVLEGATAAPSRKQQPAQQPAQAIALEDDDEGDDMEDMQARLEALRS